MAKLHELLAVAANKSGQATKVVTDLTATFGSKHHLFTEKLTVFTPLGENAQPITEEALALQSTVPKELNWAAKHINDMVDVGHAINVANTQAKADIVLENGTVLLRDVPATTLLELEKHLATFKGLVAVAPTLDPAKGYVKDEQKGAGVWKAREVVKNRTAKQNQTVVLHPPTDKHPAQVVREAVDVPTGTIRQNEWSGMITPAEKAEKLERVEELLRAVKAARSRANEANVTAGKIGATLTEYILG